MKTISKRNADTQHVLDKGTPFKDSRGQEYVTLDCSQPVFGKDEEVLYVIEKCRIVKVK